MIIKLSYCWKYDYQRDNVAFRIMLLFGDIVISTFKIPMIIRYNEEQYVQFVALLL